MPAVKTEKPTETAPETPEVTAVAPVPEVAPETPEPPRYVMPKVDVSDIVNWFDSGDTSSPGHAAVVTHVNPETIDLRLITGTMITSVYKSVRHVSDQRLKINEFNRQNGGWDYTPAMRRLMDVETVLTQAGFLPLPKPKKK